MSDCSPKQLCFPPIAGHTIRADFEGGALSSDFGALLLRGIDRQIGLTERLTAAIQDKRYQSYIDHPLRDLLAQRIYQIAAGYADANDANSLRRDPLFKLGVGVPVAGVQKTTHRWSTAILWKKTKVFAHTYGRREPLILSTFSVVFRPETGFSSPPLRLGSYASPKQG